MFIKHHHSVRPILKTPKIKLSHFFPNTHVSRWSHVKITEDTLTLDHCMIEEAVLPGYKEEKYTLSKFGELKSGSVPLFNHF